jgi:hypothetical protein
MIQGEDELLRAFANIVPVEVNEEYRAYYDTDGRITAFSASGFPIDDNWVHIDRELYVTGDWSWMRLVEGKIIKQLPTTHCHFSLTLSEKGVKVVKGHAGLVVEDSDDYADVEYYDNRNN